MLIYIHISIYRKVKKHLSGGMVQIEIRTGSDFINVFACLKIYMHFADIIKAFLHVRY